MNSQSTSRKGSGRPPRRESAMPRSGITAHADQLIFFQLLSGELNAVSSGVQKAAIKLIECDSEAKSCYNQAKWMVNRARSALCEQYNLPTSQVTQDQIWRYVKDNFFKLKQEYSDAQV